MAANEAELKSSATDEPFVAVLQAKRLQPLPNSQKQSKKVGNQLDFPLTRCKLLLEAVSVPPETNSKLISFVFQQKARENRPSLTIDFLLIELKYQQEHCILAPCWAFLWRSMSRFLVGPSRARMGKRPAFFMFAWLVWSPLRVVFCFAVCKNKTPIRRSDYGVHY